LREILSPDSIYNCTHLLIYNSKKSYAFLNIRIRPLSSTGRIFDFSDLFVNTKSVVVAFCLSDCHSLFTTQHNTEFSPFRCFAFIYRRSLHFRGCLLFAVRAFCSFRCSYREDAQRFPLLEIYLSTK